MWRTIFSDRAAWVAVPLLGLLLVGDAVAWSVYQSGAPEGVDRCLMTPESCVGERVMLPLLIVYETDGEGASVGRPSGRIRVEGQDPGLVAGTEVSVGGVFEEAGVLRLEVVEPHPWRAWKRRLGLIGALLAAGLALAALTVRRTPEGWRVVPRG